MRWIPLALTALALGLGLAACGGAQERPETPRAAKPTAPWREIATEADRDRLRKWRDAWTQALPLARAMDAQAIAAEGALFEPDRALPDAALPPGTYRCRVFKLGGLGTATRDFTAWPAVGCRVTVEGDVRRLAKTNGAQRPSGLLLPENAAREIFIGTLILSDETAPMRYGHDAARDMIGYVERIGDKRWRLVLPWPRFESTLDVVELVPAP